jgi:hypothetical protein
MVEEELVSGEGWISDDSSFYGEYNAGFKIGNHSGLPASLPRHSFDADFNLKCVQNAHIRR